MHKCCRQILFRHWQRQYIHTSSNYAVKNYYDVLGVPRNASAQQIKSAYYDKAKAYHPDTNKNNRASALKFQEISEAYEILGDTTKRRAYDSTTRPSVHSDTFGERQRMERRETRPESREPINMNHIQYVYRTLNKEYEEEAKFRPFEDHNYPNTNYNRFEYARHWDTERKVWVYTRKRSAEEYQRQMREKHKILKICLSVFSFGCLAFALCHQMYFSSSFQPTQRTTMVKDDDGKLYFVIEK